MKSRERSILLGKKLVSMPQWRFLVGMLALYRDGAHIQKLRVTFAGVSGIDAYNEELNTRETIQLGTHSKSYCVPDMRDVATCCAFVSIFAKELNPLLMTKLIVAKSVEQRLDAVEMIVDALSREVIGHDASPN